MTFGITATSLVAVKWKSQESRKTEEQVKALYSEKFFQFDNNYKLTHPRNFMILKQDKNKTKVNSTKAHDYQIVENQR